MGHSLSDLVDVLTNFRSAAATNPLDRVFTCLALAAGSEIAMLTPDYSETKRETFCRVANHLVRYG